MRNILIFIIFVTYSFSFTVYEDMTNTIKPSKIIQYKDKFTTSKKEVIKDSSYTVWLKYEFSNNTNQDINKFILFDFPLIRDVDLFYITNNTLIKQSNGYRIPIEKRDIKQSHIIFKLPIKAKKQQIAFIRIKTNYLISYSNHTYDRYEKVLYKLLIKNNIIVIQVTTFFISILLISLIVFYTKDKIYKYYLLFLFSSFTLLFSFSGYVQKFIFIEEYILFTRILVDIFVIISYLFLINILNLKNNSLVFYRLSYFIIFIYLFFLFSELLENHYIIFIRDTIIIPASFLLILSIIIYAVIKKIQFAKFLFIGWILYIIGLIIALLAGRGIVNIPFKYEYMYIGGTFESIIFSLMLVYHVKLLNNKKIQNEILLQKQSKFATIGESLSNIEHQWRTPLSEISSNIMKLEGQIDFQGMPTKRNLQKSLSDINKTLEYMTNLVDDFKNFYKQEKSKSNFHIDFSLNSALKFLEHNFKNHNITIIKKIEDDYILYGYVSEFTQVFLNILSNAQDIIIQRDIENPQISINIHKENEKIIITIEDNAGGIDVKDIDNIFNQFYSSKQNIGTGIGLYLSKVIIEDRMNGKLTVQNSKNGAKFMITL